MEHSQKISSSLAQSNFRAKLAQVRRWHHLFEEVANTITAAVGLGLAFIGVPLLLWPAIQNGDTWQIVGFSVYGLTLFALYLASTLYHAAKDRVWKHRLRVLDHCCIFLLIAGTYTPIAMFTIWERWGSELLLTVWVISLLGIGLKLFRFEQSERYSLALYVALGWLGLVVVQPLIHSLPFNGFLWVFTGGVLYSVGVLFYTWHKFPFHHAFWHIFVVLGSLCHFIAIYWHVRPE